MENKNTEKKEINYKLYGIVLIIMSVILAAFVYFTMLKPEKNPETEEITTTVVNVEKDLDEINNDEVVTEKTTINDDRYIDGVPKMEFMEIDDEVFEIMECSEDELIKTIRTYANTIGFQDSEKVVYTGECIINHNHNTKEAKFYFIRNYEWTYFNVIYKRKDGTYSCEVQ